MREGWSACGDPDRKPGCLPGRHRQPAFEGGAYGCIGHRPVLWTLCSPSRLPLDPRFRERRADLRLGRGASVTEAPFSGGVGKNHWPRSARSI